MKLPFAPAGIPLPFSRRALRGIALLVSATLAAPLGAAAEAAPVTPAAVHPPHTVPGSQVRVLPVNAHGRHYQLSIGLPGSYATSPDRRYPVLYVTDGYWDFVKMNAIAGTLVYDKIVPEFIIVAIGYAGENLDYGQLRRWELTPTKDAWNENSGHAADFLGSIENEIIPFVQREYRADPKHRVLAGASLGGLFTLYSMYTKPALFQGYIAACPAVRHGNDWLLNYEKEFVKSGRSLHARLFVAGGGEEEPDFLAAIKRYHERVVSRKHPNLGYQFRIIDGERHAGMQMEAYTRGLRWVFAPWAPIPGPAPR